MDLYHRDRLLLWPKLVKEVSLPYLALSISGTKTCEQPTGSFCFRLYSFRLLNPSLWRIRTMTVNSQ